MWTRIHRWWRPALAIDLGTANTRIATESGGVMLSEPSVVAISQGSRHVMGKGTAVGKLARQMIGRTPDSIQAFSPLSRGVIADFDLARNMLAYFLKKVAPHSIRTRPKVVISVPEGITPVERQAVFSTVERAGGGRVFLIGAAQAAAIGAGLPLAEPVASLICDLGAGTTDIGLFSMGDEIRSVTVRTAGTSFDEAIIRHLRTQFSIVVGPRTAEEIKLAIGSAFPLAQELTLEVGGRDSISGIPRRAMITSEEVREALRVPLSKIVTGLREVLTSAPTELTSDLAHTGMVLSGGSAMLRGIDLFLEDQLGVPVRIADAPETCVARGAAICLDHLSLWKAALQSAA